MSRLRALRSWVGTWPLLRRFDATFLGLFLLVALWWAVEGEQALALASVAMALTPLVASAWVEVGAVLEEREWADKAALRVGRAWCWVASCWRGRSE